MSDFVKKPCKGCPFRRDIKPYLHPERGADIAYATQNHYNSFTCHKTTEYNEDTEDQEVVEESKECAGFLTLVANECGEDVLPEGFKPSFKECYTDAWEMAQAYENQDK